MSSPATPKDTKITIIVNGVETELLGASGVLESSGREAKFSVSTPDGEDVFHLRENLLVRDMATMMRAGERPKSILARHGDEISRLGAKSPEHRQVMPPAAAVRMMEQGAKISELEGTRLSLLKEVQELHSALERSRGEAKTLHDRLAEMARDTRPVAETSGTWAEVHPAALSIIEEFRKLHPALSVFWVEEKKTPRKVSASPALGMPYGEEWAKALSDVMGIGIGEAYADLAKAFGAEPRPQCPWEARFKALLGEIERRVATSSNNVKAMEKNPPTTESGFENMLLTKGKARGLRTLLQFGKNLLRAVP